MSVLNQKTINKDITLEGIGLHSGLPVKLTIKLGKRMHWIERDSGLRGHVFVNPTHTQSNIYSGENVIYCRFEFEIQF